MRPAKLRGARTAARSVCACLCVYALTVSAGATIDAQRPDLDAFINEMARTHGFDRSWLETVIGQAEHQPSIIEAISRPAEKTKPWFEYRDIFVRDARIEAGVRFYDEHRDTLEQIAARFGVAPEVVVAIVGVESFYGRITGRYRVLDALTTLAFGYPPRSAFFRSELEQFLLLAREESIDPLTPTGSYAGAMGAPQFISSSYRAYSVDSNGDGRRDLWSDWADVLGSVANYFHRHGWRAGESVVAPARVNDADARTLAGSGLKLARNVGELRRHGVEFETALPDTAPAALLAMEGRDGPEYWVAFKNFHVITRYNRSDMYALAVHQLGSAISQRVAARTDDDAD